MVGRTWLPTSIDESAGSSGATSSLNTDGPIIGRPNKWTASRQRKLARLYLCTLLPKEDIREALKETTEDWEPG